MNRGRRVPLKKRSVELMNVAAVDEAVNELQPTERNAAMPPSVFRRSIQSPLPVAITATAKARRNGMDPPHAFPASYHTYPTMQRLPSSASMQGILAMPQLLRSTSSWGSLLGAVATATDTTAPPFFDFATSQGQIMTDAVYGTPVNQSGLPLYGFGSGQPPFRLQAAGKQPLVTGTNQQKLPPSGIVRGKITKASLLEDDTPQPTPLSEMETTRTDVSQVAAALLTLTPAALPTKKRVPFADIGQETVNSPPSKSATTKSTRTRTRKRQAKPPSSHVAVASRARDLLNNVPVTDAACKCKNSKCLKLYCVCFQTGKLCDDTLCICQDCCNTTEFSGPEGARTVTIMTILGRRIDAFDQRPKKKTGEGCACKKNR